MRAKSFTSYGQGSILCDTGQNIDDIEFNSGDIKRKPGLQMNGQVLPVLKGKYHLPSDSMKENLQQIARALYSQNQHFKSSKVYNILTRFENYCSVIFRNNILYIKIQSSILYGNLWEIEGHTSKGCVNQICSSSWGCDFDRVKFPLKSLLCVRRDIQLYLVSIL